ncbi:hypothetical protein Q361_1394 [Flavobacterium croceum DSM 17960]|uniref:Kinase n=1 Tax=Flavobacterium croceum DSM 17960 TaxID=1121886 RepID=A0A2S4N4M0_9FLAO|nr:kinase [Flavobacterium croceum]POS00631.1 hypothetical protein Q361_1394 [Flavobacterium croceum DSM 17960]
MKNILYYPYINIPKNDWTVRTLLYYDNIGTIVPQEYIWEPEKSYDSFMWELVRMSLVTPINPIEVFANPWEVTKPFITQISEKKLSLEKAQSRFKESDKHTLINTQKFRTAKIHADKFDNEVFYSLENLGLAKRDDGNWYSVETKTADQLMKYTATLVGMKTNRIPTTDEMRPRFFSSRNFKYQRKRETILENLIPFPEQINLHKLLNFKENHSELLAALTNKVEKLVLDDQIKEGTDLFNENIRELVIRKGELTAKMNESQLGNIIFGTACGIIGAVKGISESQNLSGVLWGLPGFGNAIYSALKIENAEKIFDQSGMKYLALIDKKLR